MNGFPFTNFHDINLDWILSKLKKAVFSINGQGPDENGNINLGGVAGVTSVNGVGPDSAGNVTLNAGSVGALPATYTAPVSSVNGKTGNVQLSASDVNALSNAYQPPVRSVNGQTGAVDLDAADVGALPEDWTAPVEAVNGYTGSVILNAADVGALPDTTTVPTRTSQLVNDSGFITSQQASAVTSVNGKVGAVVLDASDVSALPASTVVPTMTSQLVNDSGFITSAQAAPVTSVNSKVGAVVLDAVDVGATPAGEGMPAGGAAGQVLTKSGDADYAATWRDAPGGFTLLWTNPSAAAFAAQTISLDLSEYDMVLIRTEAEPNSTAYPNIGADDFVRVGESRRIICSANYFHSTASSSSYWLSRLATVTASGVEFATEATINIATSARSSNNIYCVPKEIYGIKL